MGSDKARVSYDPRRQYRTVVKQMGRASLEADDNEGATLSSEELRVEALDLVGPSGTPDDGFKVLDTHANRPFDFFVSGGTMYVGGERIYAYENTQYGDQPEWLDHESDPTWVSTDKGSGNELIYLYLEEREVSAVEDTALLEVALGGPD